jgi:hypothetical protein
VIDPRLNVIKRLGASDVIVEALTVSILMLTGFFSILVITGL